ncbi:MAG: hypothetical protein D8H93_07195 [Capnocytophaga sp.]|nr:MAG: hypothetical protein D8H93_07195 [Capnocytophaga sp.]
MQISELLENNRISLRTYNVCMEQRWFSSEDIRNYYNKNKNFEGIKNCGKRSAEELMRISSLDFLEKVKEEDLLNKQLLASFKKLTPPQKEIIESYIKMLTANLSPRLKNTLDLYFIQGISLQAFELFYMKAQEKAIKIKGIGRRNILDLENYFDKIKYFIVEVSKVENSEKVLLFKDLCVDKNIYPLNDIPVMVTRLGFFKVVDYLLTTPILFDESKIKLFSKAFKFYRHTTGLKLREIGKQMNITHERVRQIRNQTICDLFKKLPIVRAFDDELLVQNHIQTSGDIIFLTPEQVAVINQKSHTDFTDGFVHFILCIYLDKYQLVGNLSDVLFPHFSKKKNRHNWKNIYLVTKDIHPYLDWETLVLDICSLLEKKTAKQYEISLREKIAPYLAATPYLLDRVSKVVALILRQEFDLQIKGDTLTIPRNTYKQINEYAYEALEALGTPSYVKEIAEKVKELYPKTNFTYAGIRSSLKREYGFVPIGRSSNFGLKKWENTVENFKGGTIRDITKEFLLQQKEPQTLEQITSYLLQYRPHTNAKSILTNLKADTSDTFIFFNNSQIGLTQITYPEAYGLQVEQPVKKRTWEENYQAMTLFLQKNNRLPLSSDKHLEAIVLYRWMSVQRNLIKNGRVSQEKKDLFQALINRNYEDITS